VQHTSYEIGANKQTAIAAERIVYISRSGENPRASMDTRRPEMRRAVSTVRTTKACRLGMDHRSSAPPSAIMATGICKLARTSSGREKLSGRGHWKMRIAIAAAAATKGAIKAGSLTALWTLAWPVSTHLADVAASVQAWRVAAASLKPACFWNIPLWKYAACVITLRVSRLAKLLTSYLNESIALLRITVKLTSR
jgi:hypothetical protein